MANLTIGQLKAVVSADVSEFTKAMEGASGDVVKLAKALSDQLEPRQRAVNAAVRDFAGANDIRRAQEYADAVAQIGGAAVLTASDQQKVNAAVSEALEHYRKLGIEAPKNLVELEQATRKVETSTQAASQGAGFLDESFAKMTASLSAANLISKATGALVSLGQEAIDDAGHLVDLSEKTGLSTRSLQIYGEAAKETDSSLDDVTNSVFKLGVNISEGGDKVTGAVAELGLSYKTLRDLKPEDQFELIAQRLHDVDSVQERNRLGVELFGKTWAQIAPAVEEGLQSIADKTHIVADANLRAVDAAADAWDRFVNNLKGSIVDVLGETVQSVEGAATGLAKFLGDVEATLTGGAEGHKRYIEGLRLMAVAQQGAAKSAGEQTDAMRKAAAAAAEKEDADKKAAAAAKAHADAIKSLVDQLTGRSAQQRMSDLAEAVTKAGGEEKLTAAQTEKLGKELLDLVHQGAEVPPVLSDIWEQAALADLNSKTLTKTIDLQAQSLKLALPAWVGYEMALDKAVGSAAQGIAILSHLTPSIKLPKPPTGNNPFAGVFGPGLGQSIANAVEGGGDVFGAVGQHIGQGIAGNIGKGIADQVKKGALNKTLGTILGDAIPIVGSLMGPLISKGLGALGHLFGGGTAGRDLVKQFADQMGGFDALHDKLLQMGDAGEQMWQALSGVGRNDAKGAKQIIDSITGAIGEFDQKQAELQQHLTDDFSNLGSAVSVFGGVAPKELQPMIQQLLTMSGLTDDQRKTLEDLAKDPSMQAMQDAADRLGVKFEHMGQKFKDTQIQDQALQMVRDLKMLEDSGADMNGVLGDSKDKIVGLVQQALASGTTLPGTLKPYIDKLNEMGGLVGPDGLPLDISKLTFADIPDQALSDIKDILKDIRDLLANKIPDAASTAQKALDDMHGPDLTPRSNGNGGTIGGTGTGDTPDVSTPPPPDAQPGDGYWGVGPDGQWGWQTVPGYATGSAGLVNFNPIGQYVQLHGREEVLTASQSEGVASMVREALANAYSGGGQMQPIQLVMRERVVGEVMVPIIVNEARRLGLAGRF